MYDSPKHHESSTKSFESIFPSLSDWEDFLIFFNGEVSCVFFSVENVKTHHDLTPMSLPVTVRGESPVFLLRQERL